ncbi:MAG: glucose 1-dehydrogenase [Chloroflexota bacterium]
MNPFDLSGKVAIVTGGNGGIGLGMAQGLVSAGATVAIAGRNEAKTEAAVAELNAVRAGAASGIQCDVTDEAQVDRMVSEAVARHGRLDILVNNAGIGIRKRPEEYTLEEFERVINTNLNAVFLGCRAAYPHLKAAGAGKIVTIGSMTSIFGHPFTTPYAASKGGVVQLTRSLAIAWAEDNIQVNSILPGWIDTELTANARRVIPTLHDRVLSRTPAGRWGVPADIAGACVFLCSAASDFVTGVALPVDGGYAIQAP